VDHQVHQDLDKLVLPEIRAHQELPAHRVTLEALVLRDLLEIPDQQDHEDNQAQQDQQVIKDLQAQQVNLVLKEKKVHLDNQEIMEVLDSWVQLVLKVPKDQEEHLVKQGQRVVVVMMVYLELMDEMDLKVLQEILDHGDQQVSLDPLEVWVLQAQQVLPDLQVLKDFLDKLV